MPSYATLNGDIDKRKTAFGPTINNIAIANQAASRGEVCGFLI
jgi:hypothetical protein